MADISNKALAIFVLTAMSVSVLGFLATFQSLDGVTGRATTDTGNANFTINSSISVVFTTNSVEFGIGTVNASGFHNCTLNTSGVGMLAGGSNSITGPDCLGFNATVPPLLVQNQGNQNVTLNMSFNATATEFVGGTLPYFSFRAVLNETGACGNTTSQSLFLNQVQSSVSAANTNFSICNSTMFNWVSGNRTISLDLGLRIPQDAPSGIRRVTITAFASSP